MQLFAKIALLVLMTFSWAILKAQDDLPIPIDKIKGKIMNPLSPAMQNQAQTGADQGTTGETDSLGFTRRDDSKDAVTVTWRYPDSVRRHFMDSSVNDIDTYFPVPSNYNYLGNNGAAAYPLIFSPYSEAGWDAGFHAFDLYKFKMEDTRLYRSTKPFTALNYQLASGKEQMIRAMHVQNPRPNFGFGFEYRMINAPGFFVTQNTNHNSYRFFSNYTGKKKRYRFQLIALGNSIKASENGGLVNDSSLSDPNKRKRFSVPVNLGGGQFIPNPFQTAVKTGNFYGETGISFRQSYDLGKEDSLEINDSTMEFLFYPRLRIMHTFTYSTEEYKFRDEYADSAVYASWYGVTLPDIQDTFELREKWKIIENDLSLVQFPDPSNTSRFFRAGAKYQMISSEGKPDMNNLILHGQVSYSLAANKWDLNLSGEFYAAGLNGGDYALRGAISRRLRKSGSLLRLHLLNVNRTPSFVFDSRSAFNLGNPGGFRKENNTVFGAALEGRSLTLGFRNHLLSNYSYFSDYYHTAQYSRVFSVLQVYGSKTFSLGKRWKWYLDATAQQTDGAAPVKLPLLFARSRLAFEGVFFRNLNLCTGIEARYATPWKMPNYSPVMGAFMPQDSSTVHNLPDISAFLHFRIKGFTAFLRAENLNTASFADGFAFTRNNFAALHYPTQGLIIRVGIKWWFVN